MDVESDGVEKSAAISTSEGRYNGVSAETGDPYEGSAHGYVQEHVEVSWNFSWSA